jgi:hypothetical protein
MRTQQLYQQFNLPLPDESEILDQQDRFKLLKRAIIEFDKEMLEDNT